MWLWVTLQKHSQYTFLAQLLTTVMWGKGANVNNANGCHMSATDNGIQHRARGVGLEKYHTEELHLHSIL